MSLGALFLSVDTETDRPAAFQMQRAIMDCFIFSEDEAYRHKFATSMMDFFVRDVSNIDNVCSWNGISCANGLVQSIDLPPADISRPVSMEWIPPTVTRIQLYAVYFRTGWSSEILPRRLKYFYVANCHKRPGFVHERRAFTPSLLHLPDAMEELMSINSWYEGNVYIDRLPIGLRILMLKSSSIQKALVNFDDLRWSLISLVIASDGPLRIRSTSRSKTDPRVKTAFSTVDTKRVYQIFGGYDSFQL